MTDTYLTSTLFSCRTARNCPSLQNNKFTFTSSSLNIKLTKGTTYRKTRTIHCHWYWILIDRRKL